MKKYTHTYDAWTCKPATNNHAQKRGNRKHARTEMQLCLYKADHSNIEIFIDRNRSSFQSCICKTPAISTIDIKEIIKKKGQGKPLRYAR